MVDALTTPPKRRLRVLIVDDSDICRATLTVILMGDGDIEVVGEGEDGFGALALVESLAPDLVTMDVQMPGKSGLEAVEQIMARHPVPILVVTAEPLGGEHGVAHTAIQNGALDIVSKPSITDNEAGASLRSLVRTLAEIPVFRRVDVRHVTTAPQAAAAVEVIAIVAGKGGIASVIGLVSRLPSRLRVPVVLYEPTPPGLVSSYQQHLGRICKLKVRVATGAEAKCVAGELLVIPGVRTTWIDTKTLRLDEGAMSASDFFRGMSEILGPRGAGVILDGQGSDGAQGLGALRDAGGRTFTITPAAGDVGSMPRAAIEAGAVDGALSIEMLAAELVTIGN